MTKKSPSEEGNWHSIASSWALERSFMGTLFAPKMHMNSSYKCLLRQVFLVSFVFFNLLSISTLAAAALQVDSYAGVINLEKWADVSISVRLGSEPLERESDFFKTWSVFSELKPFVSDPDYLFEETPVRRLIPALGNLLPIDIQIKATDPSVEHQAFYVRVLSSPSRSSDAKQYAAVAVEGQNDLLRAHVPARDVSQQPALLVCTIEGDSHEICFGNLFKLEGVGPGILTGNSNNRENLTVRRDASAQANSSPCGSIGAPGGPAPFVLLITLALLLMWAVSRTCTQQWTRLVSRSQK
jgi:hypothetical protein